MMMMSRDRNFSHQLFLKCVIENYSTYSLIHRHTITYPSIVIFLHFFYIYFVGQVDNSQLAILCHCNIFFFLLSFHYFSITTNIVNENFCKLLFYFFVILNYFYWLTIIAEVCISSSSSTTWTQSVLFRVSRIYI